VNPAERAARRQQRRFGVLCVLAYLTLAWAVRFDLGRAPDHSTQIASLLYPLDTFSMYADVPGGEMGYLLVRDATGTVHQVTDFRSFDCAEPLQVAAARCSERHRIHYLYRDLAQYVAGRAGPGSTQVDLVIRTWRLQPGAAAVRTSDCVITRCRVAR
jgi:hypothetical protein